MFIWRSSGHVECIAYESDVDLDADRQYYGQQTYCEYYAFWHVPIDGQPDGRFRYRRSDGCAYADALRAGYIGALGAGFADGACC